MNLTASIVLVVTLSAGCAFAQSGIEVPAIGEIVDFSGALRSVQGIAGNFWLAPATVPEVLSSACSERLCLAKTDSKILSPTGETDAPQGTAIFSLDGDRAMVYFEESHTFALWRDDVLKPLDWILEGDVLSILLHDRKTEIAVREDGYVLILDPEGSVADVIADATGPVLLLADGILFARADQIVLRRPDATDVSFELPDARRIEAMGPHYAAIYADGAIYLLRIDKGREGLFLLPGTTP